MRNFIVTFFILLLSYSCSKKKSAKDIAITNIQEMLKDNLHDPDSYEFVSITKFDTLYKRNHYSVMNDFYISSTLRYDSLVKDTNLWREANRNSMDDPKTKSFFRGRDSTILDLKDFIEVYSKYSDSLKMENANEIVEYSTVFSFRAKNAMGAKTLNRNKVVLDKEFNVISINN